MSKSPEQFDPKQYKSYEELPEEKKQEFVPVEDGFAKKEAAELAEINEENIYASKPSHISLEGKARLFNEYVKNKDFLNTEAPELLTKGREGMTAIAEKIGIKMRARDVESIEAITRAALQIVNEFDKDASPFLEATTDAFIKTEGRDYNHWSHSVCHLVENYGRDVSFLDTAQSRKILTKLIDESVRRQKENMHEKYRIGSSSRIVGPIVEFNLAETALSKLDHPYLYKPKSLNDKEYVDILKNDLDDKYDFYIKAFLGSNTPLEFYRSMMKQGSELDGLLEPERQVEVLQTLEKRLGKELIDDYVKRVYHPNGQEINYEELIKNFRDSKEAHEVIKGIYVDVEGTLIRNDALNDYLVEQLKKSANEGERIVIFTGGNTKIVEKQLKELGLPEQFFPVHAKGDYRGKELETLIDDTPPVYQGFRATKFKKIRR